MHTANMKSVYLHGKEGDNSSSVMNQLCFGLVELGGHDTPKQKMTS